MKNILQLLNGTDRRSIGRSNVVVDMVLQKPALFTELIQGLVAESPIIRMRSADAIEKITLDRPEFLIPYKKLLISRLKEDGQAEVRWHLAQIIPRLSFSDAEKNHLFETFSQFLSDKSKIVVTFSLQALADLARGNRQLQNKLLPLLNEMITSGSPAIKNRSKKLLHQIKKSIQA